MEFLNQTLHVSEACILVLCASVWGQAALALPKAHSPSGWMEPNANLPTANAIPVRMH